MGAWRTSNRAFKVRNNRHEDHLPDDFDFTCTRLLLFTSFREVRVCIRIVQLFWSAFGISAFRLSENSTFHQKLSFQILSALSLSPFPSYHERLG